MNLVEFGLGKLLQVDHCVVGAVQRADQLDKLQQLVTQGRTRYPEAGGCLSASENAADGVPIPSSDLDLAMGRSPSNREMENHPSTRDRKAIPIGRDLL